MAHLTDSEFPPLPSPKKKDDELKEAHKSSSLKEDEGVNEDGKEPEGGGCDYCGGGSSSRNTSL